MLQKWTRRFNRKKVVFVERIICVILLLAMIAGGGVWVQSRIFSGRTGSNISDTGRSNSMDDVPLKEENLNQEEKEPVYDFMCMDGTLSSEVSAKLTVMAQTDERVSEILQNTKIYPIRILELLAKNEETIEFVQHYPDKKDENPAETIGEVEKGEIPQILQWDERWGYQTYGDGIMADSGCGPTALSMVASGLTGNTSVTPYKIAQYADANGYYVEGAGSSWELMTEVCYQFGVVGTEISLGKEQIIGELNAGHPIICSMRPGDFTDGGHFIVLTGMQGDKIEIRDPNSIKKSEQLWTYETLEPQIENLWSFTIL